MLTDTGVRKAKATDKPQKLADGGGMDMLLNPNGSRWWRFDYRFNGKRKTLSMGIYPATDAMTVHGFRATARTILDEVLGYRVDYIERQQAHAVKDPNGRAYNRTAHLPERRKMMQGWADYLDSLRIGGKIVAFTRSA